LFYLFEQIALASLPLPHEVFVKGELLEKSETFAFRRRFNIGSSFRAMLQGSSKSTGPECLAEFFVALPGAYWTLVVDTDSRPRFYFCGQESAAPAGRFYLCFVGCFVGCFQFSANPFRIVFGAFTLRAI
jgi:hypothetical protein